MPISRARLKISDYRDERKSRAQTRDRRIRIVSLSLTSMVDMFAILVIFLLTNTESVSQWIEVGEGLQLPKAKYVESPSKGDTIQITAAGLSLGGKRVATEKEPEALLGHLQSLPRGTLLNIVADDSLPYLQIKKVLKTCQRAGFQDIHLAVQPLN